MIRKGTLTVLENIPERSYSKFRVKCDCGNEFDSFPSRWKTYSGNGCGKCYRTRMFAGSKNPKYRHGGAMENKLEMNSYRAMIARCYNANYQRYDLYGGRGIIVCERWRGEDGFAHFLEDMGKKPTPKHSVDRVDRNGNYEPSNCIWATQKEQMSHVSSNKLITIGNETRIVSEWAEVKGVNLRTVYSRRQLGWSWEKAINTPSEGLGSNQQTY